MSEREDIFYKAKLAEQAERYDEMVEAMRKIASLNLELTVEERNLFAVACKNVIGARRPSWRMICSIEQKEESKRKLEIIRTYRSQVEKELRDICSDIIGILDKHLIPNASKGEFKVFYNKMKGDYYKYMAEFSTGTDKKKAAENSLTAYKAASGVAMKELPAPHPIRLALALNLSGLYYEILNSPDQAFSVADAALNDAIAGLFNFRLFYCESDTFYKECLKESKLIMQHLRNNLDLWTSGSYSFHMQD